MRFGLIDLRPSVQSMRLIEYHHGSQISQIFTDGEFYTGGYDKRRDNQNDFVVFFVHALCPS